MWSPRIRNEPTDRQPTIGAERRTTSGHLGEGAVDPPQARGNKGLNIASRTCLAVALWYYRLKAMLWVNAQREASCA